MNYVSFAFRPEWLERLNDTLFPEKFNFLIDDEIYSCHPLLACCLSKKVMQLLLVDSTQNSIKLNTHDPCKLFGQLFQVVSGGSFHIHPENWTFFYEIGSELGNTEICQAAKQLSLNTLTIETAIERAIQCYNLGLDFDVFIEFIASHFSEFLSLNLFHFEKVPIPIIEAIITSNHLHLVKEDDVFSFLQKFQDASLYYLINPDKLSLQAFNSFIESLNFSDLRIDQWTSIKNQIQKLSNEVSSYKDSGAMNVTYLSNSFNNTYHNSGCDSLNDHSNNLINDSLDNTLNISLSDSMNRQGNEIHMNGIFARLWNDNNGDIVDKGLINITSDEYQQSLQNLINPNNYFDCWGGDTQESSVITFDFVKLRINLTHYGLKTCGCMWGKYPRSWELFGSDDKNNWTKLDTIENDPDMNQRNFCKIFPVSKQLAFRYIKFVPLANYADNKENFFIRLRRIEFFGLIIPCNP
ncbi:hypothetical protein TRFO_40526 [Tritrichomonas foetus]|uniref:F5/8 type C domain-containing protein n=1 Tax=Tritrichomonas foetus TaxID=1144522 RepID=A0A1J4J6T9_9EUKA|nr:hypothetical protein TRFO_40526 [Tritrichomonas foetus]|eukprot:OHS93149.1 hypothetical protein TRFO_40526 [Tritrichomonas foetus]